jgi:hypothetical protein
VTRKEIEESKYSNFFISISSSLIQIVWID